jgi:hypothetical protein
MMQFGLYLFLCVTMFLLGLGSGSLWTFTSGWRACEKYKEADLDSLQRESDTQRAKLARLRSVLEEE